MKGSCCRLFSIVWIASLILLHFEYTQADEWDITTLIDGMTLKDLGRQSLAIRASGTTGMAFSGDHLYYSSNDGSSWSTPQIIDPTPNASAPALAFNGSGFPYIAYIDKKFVVYHEVYMLKLAFQTLNWPGPTISWHITEITYDVSASPSPSLAIDSLGFAHIAYRDSEGSLAYAYEDGEGWHSGEIVDNDISSLYDSPSLALGSDNTPVIAYTPYFSGPTGHVRFAKRHCSSSPLSCSWAVEGVSVDYFGSSATDGAQVVFDASDHPHVFWLISGMASGDPDIDHLLHAYKDGDTWIDMGWKKSGEGMDHLTAFKDANDDFHLSWVEYGSDRLVYLSSTDELSYLVENTPNHMCQSMVITTGGTPLVAYSYGSQTSAIDEVRADGTGWLAETLWRENDFHGLALELDSNENPHAVYEDENSREIRRADFDGSDWSFGSILSDVDVRGNIAFLLGPADLPNLAYIDDTSEEALFMNKVCAQSICLWMSPEVVDTATGYIDLQVDGNNTPHVSFTDSGGTVLKYAYRLSGNWSSQVLDTASISIVQNSMDLSSSGMLKIAYVKDWNEIFLANRSCGSICFWGITGPVNDDSYPDVDELILRLDSTSTPHMAAYSMWEEPNRWDYLWLGTSGWQSMSIPDNGALSGGIFHFDFCIEESGNPHFVFFESDSSLLQYGKRLSNYRWQTTTILQEQVASVTPAMQLDVDGQPHIIFVNGQNDLMYAVKTSSALAGDINRSGTVDLTDAIVSLQVLTEAEIVDIVSTSGDANGDNQIGLAETLYILQEVTDQ